MDFFHKKQVKAAMKERKCWGCKGKIEVGSPCLKVVGVIEGDFYHYSLCSRCDNAIEQDDVLADEIREFFEEGAVKQYLEEKAIPMFPPKTEGEVNKHG